jgi:hypothetical protein
MKLHTDFHDYYDNAVGYGIDEKVHYNRFTKEVEIKFKPKKDFPRVITSATPYLLGFCGETYPVLKVVKYEDAENDYGNFNVIDSFYAFNYQELKDKNLEWHGFGRFFEYNDKRREIETKQFFTDWKYKDDQLFLEYKSPVWLLDLKNHFEQKIVLNPKLKDYGFNRIKDSFTAFQEISMYLSNILVEQKEVVKIEDKYRIEQHGFDLKTSFRKEKISRKT